MIFEIVLACSLVVWEKYLALIGPSTNNLSEYHAAIGLLMESLASDVREIRIYLESELVFQQLNQVYLDVEYYRIHTL